MKYLITIILCAFSLVGIAQEKEQICKERSHVKGEATTVSLLYCAPEVIDLEDKTIKIYRDCNYTSSNCGRCGQFVRFPPSNKKDTIVVWKRKPE